MPVLTTYAALTWLINGLHNRPGDDTAGRAVVSVALPQTQDWNAGDPLLQGVEREYFETAPDFSGGYPYNPCGLIFLREMVIPPESNTIRLSMGRQLDEHGFYANFGMAEQALRARIMSNIPAIGESGSNVQRFPMRKGLTKKARRVVEEPSSFPTLLDQTPANPQEHNFGPDIAPDLPDPPGYLGNTTPTLAERAAHIWGQFATDIIQKIGNPKGRAQASYCRFSQERRELATIDTLKTVNLKDIFTQVQVRADPNKKQWNDAFDALFPVKGQVFSDDSQHWNKLAYHQKFIQLMDESTHEQMVAIRLEMWGKFCELPWAPAADFTRLWYTRRLGGSKSFPRNDSLGPHVIWNYTMTHLKPTFDAPDATLLREEEEESSDAAESQD